jgi:hypothetical protein
MVTILFLFFIRGRKGIEYLAEDLVASKDDGIRLYNLTRNGQRGVSIEM